MSNYDEYQIVINEAQRRLIMRALTNAMANDRRSTAGGALNADAAPQVTLEEGDDRVSGTDANRHDDISHNGSSESGGSADRADTVDLVAPCKAWSVCFRTNLLTDLTFG